MRTAAAGAAGTGEPPSRVHEHISSTRMSDSLWYLCHCCASPLKLQLQYFGQLQSMQAASSSIFNMRCHWFVGCLHGWQTTYSCVHTTYIQPTVMYITATHNTTSCVHNCHTQHNSNTQVSKLPNTNDRPLSHNAVTDWVGRAQHYSDSTSVLLQGAPRHFDDALASRVAADEP